MSFFTYTHLISISLFKGSFEYKLILSNSATSLGMMSDEEKRVQRIEDIKELLS